MATIVLTAVGGVLGGPVGAAIGSLAGQAIDREVLFRPKGRHGPRLTELAIQGSSYGAPIPHLFGTMRVAGQVIWATDLKESRNRQGGGKGQPSTTSYSYSASFAVLLSARPIIAVRRIWADGKLLRGAAGDWKTRTGFRLHTGGDAQAPDPLIASLEGIGRTPAMRGQAYAVFEDLALADFGNRIPSLTFEVDADAGPVTIGAIAAHMSRGGIADEFAAPVDGYAAHGDSLAGALAPLADVAGAGFHERDGRLVLRAPSAPMATLSDEGAVAEPGRGDGRASRGMGTLEAVDAVPARIALAHHDPVRDYQIGMQTAARRGHGRVERRIELPAALHAPAAKALAEDVLARELAARATRTLRMAWRPGLPRPGDSVTLADRGGRWRVRATTLERMVTELELVRIAAAPMAALPASPGRVLAEPDLRAGTTRIIAFEPWPSDDAAKRPMLAVAACGAGPGWRGAEVMVRGGGGAWETVGRVRVPSAIGEAILPLGPGSPALIDEASRLVVQLDADLDLMDADTDAIARGKNSALVGDELIQFMRAEPLGQRRWALTRLLRARRGSDEAMVTHSAGTRFVLLDGDALLLHPLPVEVIGGEVEVLASGIEDARDAPVPVFISGRSVAPPAPVHPRLTRAADGGFDINWTRRSRSDWSWRDTLDAGLGETLERSRVTISGGDATVRVIEVGSPHLHYPAVELGADRRAANGEALRIAIRQIGDIAVSAPLDIDL